MVLGYDAPGFPWAGMSCSVFGPGRRAAVAWPGTFTGSVKTTPPMPADTPRPAALTAGVGSAACPQPPLSGFLDVCGSGAAGSARPRAIVGHPRVRSWVNSPPSVCCPRPGEVEGVEVLSMVAVVLGSGLGPAGRIPLNVTAAGIAVVAEGLSEFGRFSGGGSPSSPPA